MTTQDLTVEEMRHLRKVMLQTMGKLKKAIRSWWGSGCCDTFVLLQLEIVKARLENSIARVEIAIRERMIEEAECGCAAL